MFQEVSTFTASSSSVFHSICLFHSSLCDNSILYLFLLLQHNSMSMGMDINVTGVWERNITGQGVTVVVVDDGVEHTHQDIHSNYVSQE